MKLWKDAKRTNAQDLITWLLSVRESNGWPIDLQMMIAFSELGASSILPGTLNNQHVMPVLTVMKEQSKTSIEDFEEIYTEQKKEKSIKRQKSTDVWHFYIPLNISFQKEISLPSTIKVLGRDFRFMTHRMASRNVEEGAFKFITGLRLLKLVTSDDIPNTFLYATSRGESWEDAWQELEPAFDTLRGIMEITFGLGSLRLSSDPTPRRNVPHPQWLIARLGDQEARGLRFIVDDISTDQNFLVTKNKFSAIKRNARLFKDDPAKGSTLEIAADCFRLYAQAMDTRWPYACFLSLWQLAEAITLSETVGGLTEKVCERLSWHSSRTKLQGSGFTDTIKVFAKKRNDIVHRGIHNVTDDDINIMKHICETALRWLISERHRIPSSLHLDQFYRLRELNDAEVEARKDIIKYIAVHRGIKKESK
jgi:hypothetical protein